MDSKEIAEVAKLYGANVPFIYPTVPFLTAEKLENTLNEFEQSEADSLIPVVIMGRYNL